MAYGDATLQEPPVPWEEFEYTEYLYRLEELLGELFSAFALACHPLSSDRTASDANAEYLRLRKALEETAIEFAAYCARLRLELAEDGEDVT